MIFYIICQYFKIKQCRIFVQKVVQHYHILGCLILVFLISLLSWDGTSQEITMQGTCLCHLTSQECIIRGTGFIDKAHFIAILVIFNYHYHNWVFFNFNLLLKLYQNIDFDLICWKKVYIFYFFLTYVQFDSYISWINPESRE